MKSLIEKYKNRKKQAIICSTPKGTYAFVGIGSHSLANLYPVLDFLKVHLKYIVTRSAENAALVNENYRNITGTNDIALVLNDPEIKGLLVCASPPQHYQLCKQILESGKHLFVEKPPCYTSDELKQLISITKDKANVSLVGLQKRYAPVYTKLKTISSKVDYYSLKYQTGAYPEGDVLLDLFIHPLDLSVFLFGKANPVSVQKIKRNESCYTYLIHLKHENGITGALELSTDYSWTGANEQLTLNTSKGVYHSERTSSLTFTEKPRIIAGIPMEKVKIFNPATRQLFMQNDFLPVKEHNQLYSAGFYNEIETFINLCEGRKAINKSSLEQLEDSYELIEKIRG